MAEQETKCFNSTPELTASRNAVGLKCSSYRCDSSSRSGPWTLVVRGIGVMRRRRPTLRVIGMV